MKLIVLLVLCLGLLAVASAQLSRLLTPVLTSPILKDQGLLRKPTSNIIITLKDPLGPIVDGVASTVFPSREAKIQELHMRLKDATRTFQAPVLAALAPFGVETESYWITNQIYVKNANPTTISLLLTTLFALLKSISEEVTIPLLPLITNIVGVPPTGPEWGVRKIGAVDVWNQTKGAGALVGVIDTGVRKTHVAIGGNYVGDDKNGWFDPITLTPSPTDDNGHGTHCTGVICGNNGIGVAPEAKWMACRGCTSAGCPEHALIACGEFMVCPTDATGLNRNCSYAPKIVSNSWGGGSNATWYNDVIKSWNAVDIIPVFAIGNAGPDCGTANSPGDQDGVISVGSTSMNDVVSSFSSRGPRVANDGVIKPEITAPGEDINSAYYYSDNSYQILSGTSMATPHTAGAIALLVSKNPSLKRQDVENLLFPNAFRGLGASTDGSCGANDQSTYPNDVAGYGRLNIEAAFDKLVNPTP